VTIKKLLLSLALLFPLFVQAQSITPAQIEQFKSLPKAQQEALARQYGVDLNQFTQSQQPGISQPAQPVVRPLDESDAGKNRTSEEQSREQEQKKTRSGFRRKKSRSQAFWL
jgi:hypothetical protein